MTRIEELKSVIGKDCSCNYSPTLKAKLISVGKFKSTLEVTATMYSRAQWSNAHVGQKILLDNTIIHNMYFYQPYENNSSDPSGKVGSFSAQGAQEQKNLRQKRQT